MTIFTGSITNRIPESFSAREAGLSEEDFAKVDPFIYEALTEIKRQGLFLGIRARWIALAAISVPPPSLNFR